MYLLCGLRNPSCSDTVKWACYFYSPVYVFLILKGLRFFNSTIRDDKKQQQLYRVKAATVRFFKAFWAYIMQKLYKARGFCGNGKEKMYYLGLNGIFLMLWKSSSNPTFHCYKQCYLEVLVRRTLTLSYSMRATKTCVPTRSSIVRHFLLIYSLV